MPFLLLKNLPRFECLIEASKRHPTLNPSACAAFLNLLHTGDLLFEKKGEYLGAHRISDGRFNVMMLLLMRKPDGCGAAELADCAGVSRATMSGLLDVLERDGRVQREPEPEDRRAVRVALTEKGRAEMEALLPGYFERVTEMMEPLSERELKQLVQLLQKIQASLSSPDAQPEPPVCVQNAVKTTA